MIGTYNHCHFDIGPFQTYSATVEITLNQIFDYLLFVLINFALSIKFSEDRKCSIREWRNPYSSNKIISYKMCSALSNLLAFQHLDFPKPEPFHHPLNQGLHNPLGSLVLLKFTLSELLYHTGRVSLSLQYQVLKSFNH